METRHHRCVCGALFPLQLVVCVDAEENPELAARILNCTDDAQINRGECPQCQVACGAAHPFIYHLARQGLLVLVLPESYRHRELEERASLLTRLSRQEAALPAYAADFATAYGPKGLVAILQSGASTASDEGKLKDDAQASESKAILDARTAELDARSSALTEREIALQDRKAALDRRTDELEEKTDAVATAREKLRAESEDSLPIMLREDATQALSTDDILTSAPDPSVAGPMKIPSSASVSGSSVSSPPRDPLDDLIDEETPPILLDKESNTAENRAEGDIVTDKLLELKDTEPNVAEKAPKVPKPPVVAKKKSKVAGSKAPTDPDIIAWCKRRGHALKLLRGHDIWLVASVGEGALNELGASDIRALLQLHRMDSYPLVTLTLAKAKTLAGAPGKPFSFHFDVGDTADREMLEQLAKDFRFKLELFTTEHRPLQERRLAAPLSTNVHFVVALALDTLRDMPADKRSFAGAMKAFAEPGHDRLGRSHQLAREFKDSQLDKLATAEEVQVSLALCERFSAAEGEEYLVATRSYPYERWHQRRLQVIRKAMELGLWMGPSLAQVAVSEGLVRSARELLARCQNNFATFVSQGGKGLASAAIDKNWASLEAQAVNLGIAGATIGGNTVVDNAVGLGLGGDPNESDSQLMKRLDNPDERLAVIAQLSHRQVQGAVDPISRALAELGAVDAPAAFASFIKLGAAATASLMVFLECPTPHLRHAAALALCELRDDAGIDSICESLMTEEGSLWREYAMALGQVGASAIMPVVARVAGKGKREQARAVWALGYIAGQGGRKSIETLAKGKDTQVAHVAQSALDLEGRLREGSIASERDAQQSEFSEAFYSSLAGSGLAASSAEISGQAMQLEEADLMEASDP